MQLKYCKRKNQYLIYLVPRIYNGINIVWNLFLKQCQQKIQQIIKGLSIQLRQTVKTHFENDVQNYMKLIKQITNLKEQQKNIETLQQIFQKNTININFQRKKFIKLFFNYQKRIGVEINSFYSIKQIVNYIKNIEFKYENQSKILFIDNKCCLVSIQQSNVDKIIQKYSFVDCYIFCAKTIIIENNIIAKGKDIFFVCQLIQFKSQILIDLSGNPSDHNYNDKAKKQNGKNGKKGYDSGSIYISTQQINGRNITVNLSGGKGGKGQDVQIDLDFQQYSEIIQKDPQNGKDQQRIFLKSRQPYGWMEKKGLEAFTHVAKQILTFNGQVLQTYRTDTIKAWEKYYQKQCSPGKGGLPGKSGILRFIGDNFNHKFKIINQNYFGQNGLVYVDIFERKYVRQMIFCKFRKQGQKIQDQKADIPLKQIALAKLSSSEQVVTQEIIKEVEKQEAQHAAENISQKYIQARITQKNQKVIELLSIFQKSRFVLPVILSPISALITDGWTSQFVKKGKESFKFSLAPQNYEPQFKQAYGHNFLSNLNNIIQNFQNPQINN